MTGNPAPIIDPGYDSTQMWRRRCLRAAAMVSVAVAVIAPAGPASAVPTRLPYQFTVRAAPVEAYVHYFREVDNDIGFSRVQLAHRSGDLAGVARALAAAYWPAIDDEPCLLGCEPPCPESALVNPTVARTSTPRECTDRVPGPANVGVPPSIARALAGLPAPRATVNAPSDVFATGSSRVLDPSVMNGVNIAAAGSSATASMDRNTGRFLGVARSFVTDLVLPGGSLAAVTSLLQVTATPGADPVVDYRLSLTSATGAGASSDLGREGFTIAGSRVPLAELVGNVNGQLAELGSVLGTLADLGVRVLAPIADRSDDGRRFRVSAPVLLLGVDPAVALPAPTGGSGVRVGSAIFEGSYAAPDPPLR